MMPLAISPNRLMPSRASLTTDVATCATRATGDGAAFFADVRFLAADVFFTAAFFRFAAAGRRFFVVDLRAADARFTPRFAERFAAGRFRAPFFADPRAFVDRLVEREDLRFVAMSAAPGRWKNSGLCTQDPP
jgi:hypothetical protein